MNQVNHSPEIWVNRPRFHHVVVIVYPVHLKIKRHRACQDKLLLYTYRKNTRFDTQPCYSNLNRDFGLSKVQKSTILADIAEEKQRIRIRFIR